MKSATDYFEIPNNQFFITNSIDGSWLSSDFYLRTAGAAIQMMKGLISETVSPPVQYSQGPIYYRNSFESMYVQTSDTIYDGIYPVDPCFNNPTIIIDSSVNSPSVAIVHQPSFAHHGSYSTQIKGFPASSTSANYYYKIADTKIGVNANMQLSFWKYSANTLGQYTSIDLIFKSGLYLHNLSMYKDNNGNPMTPSIARGNIGAWQNYTCSLGQGELIGDTITGIIIGYDHPASSDSINAYFDDVVIQNIADSSTSAICPGEGTLLIAGAPQNGNTYQWQLNSGSGYMNIADNNIYWGVNNDTLLINDAPDSLYGNLFRCVINNNSIASYSPVYTMQFVDNWTGAAGTSTWETPANWSCNTIPGQNTDVIINFGTVILNSTTAIRSISINPGVNFIINSPHILNVAH